MPERELRGDHLSHSPHPGLLRCRQISDRLPGRLGHSVRNRRQVAHVPVARRRLHSRSFFRKSRSFFCKSSGSPAFGGRDRKATSRKMRNI
jgi:hypothetical protein